MAQLSTKLIIMQWLVIIVLAVGASVAVWLVVNKADQYQEQLHQQSGSIDSLRQQLRQSKTSPATNLPLPPGTTAIPQADTNLMD